MSRHMAVTPTPPLPVPRRFVSGYTFAQKESPMKIQRVVLTIAVGLLIATPVLAQQNRGAIKRIPPAGVAVPESDRKELEAGVELLGKEIADLRQSLAKTSALLDLLPDVQIYHNAVRYAL